MTGSLLVSDHVEARHGAELDAAAPAVPRVVLRPDGPDGDPADVEVAFFSGDLYPARAREFWLTLFTAKRLRWLHSFSAGVDHPVFQRVIDQGARLTTSSGASAIPIAHTVMLYVLAMSRDLRRWMEAQRRHAWEPRDIVDLQGQVLGVIGLGPIGLEVARLGAAFGMRVIALRRTPRGDEPCETWPMSRFHDLLEIADHVVLALPLTDETRHLLDAAALARLKPTAVVVNVGRGPLIDEAALAEALAHRRIGGAALDVFAAEPLPPTSPLWDLPNVIVTPHSAGDNPGNNERAVAIFIDNLARYAAGLPLRNEVTGMAPHE